VRQEQNDLRLAKQQKLLAELKLQLLEAKGQANEMESERDMIMEEHREKKEFMQTLEAKVEEQRTERKSLERRVDELADQKEKLLVSKEEKTKKKAEMINEIEVTK